MKITDKTQVPIPPEWEVTVEDDSIIIRVPRSAIDPEKVEQLSLEGAAVVTDLPSGDLTIVL